MSKHTPTDWTYREAFDNGEPCGYVVQSGVNPIADVLGENAEADAEFIVRACNNHEKLVAALGEMLDAYAPGRHEHGRVMLHSAVRHALEAIDATKETP